MRIRKSSVWPICILLAAGLAMLPLTSAPTAAPPAGMVDELTYVTQVGGAARAVAADENFVYLGAGPRLFILDISDPAHPAVVGSVDGMTSEISAIALYDRYVFVTAELGGLYVVHADNPAAPELVGYAVTLEGTCDVAVQGAYAYVVDTMEGVLRVMDASVRDSPTEVGSFPSWRISGVGVGADPGVVYLANEGEGLLILDVTDPANPVSVGAFSAPGARDVFIAGTTAYVIGADGLIIVGVANPAAPVELGRIATSAYALRVTVQGDFAYVADALEGLRVIRVSNPAAPVEVGLLDTPGYASDVALAGGMALVTDYAGGLRIISVADPAAPAELGLYDAGPGHAAGVAVQGDYAFVAALEGSLSVLDISDPAHPAVVGSIAVPGVPQGVTVADGIAYVSCAARGDPQNTPGDVSIISIADPAHPALLARYEVPGSGAFGVALKGGAAFIAAAEHGVFIVDISDPMQPRQIGAFLQCNARDLAIQGDLLSVADPGGTKILYVRSPANPTLYEAFDGSSDAVAASGGWLFDAQFITLRMTRLSTTQCPEQIGEYYIPAGMVTDLCARGRYVLPVMVDGGIRIYRINDASELEEVAYYDVRGWPRNVVVSDPKDGTGSRYVYVATERMGLHILRFEPGAEEPAPTATPTPLPTPTPHPPTRYSWFFPFVWEGPHGIPVCVP